MQTQREIFLVDDEVAFTDTMSILLEAGAGMPVAVFNDPVRALDALRKRKPTFVVSDLAMPEMDGFAFLREVEKLHPDLPCALVTGNHLDRATIKANETSNLTRVLFKPVSWRDIATLIPETPHPAS